ncbi:MAG: GGDEF domain-containing protein [Candidatus Omnitrophica bacterium]|nr:GGDEF domain-containing protein [Candidatus Omnitrophota bacterium]
MWRRISIVIGSLIISFLHLGRLQDSGYLFFLIPFIFLLLFYFLVIEDRFSTAALAVISLFLIASSAYQAPSLLYLCLLLILAATVLCTFLYQKSWAYKIAEAEMRRRETEKEMNMLEERHRIRLDSLEHLEQRVNGLVHLFEVARDLNECLNFSEILSVLNEKIVPVISFTYGTIILLDTEGSGKKMVRNYYMVGAKKRDEKEMRGFMGACLEAVGDNLQPVKFEKNDISEKTDFRAYQAKFPVWLFPLAVEQRLIAIFAVEGGEANDFQKFEVFASQLALQTKKVGLYETVRELSIVDGLTQVFVRRHFLERFQEELKRAVRYQFPLSVLMVDVDYFKSYNDKFGHLVGDKTLYEVAQVIRENVRRVDVIGRYGGEEFAIVAPEIEKTKALELAERIRSAVARKHFLLYDEETQVTVSIGLSTFPADLGIKEAKEPVEPYIPDLIEKADEALYRAKEDGRNRAVAFS